MSRYRPDQLLALAEAELDNAHLMMGAVVDALNDCETPDQVGAVLGKSQLLILVAAGHTSIADVALELRAQLTKD